MKKAKEPGGNISLKTKKNESPAVMEWINAQTNLMDSIRYLIENEIRLNGVRNLQHFIPAERSALESQIYAGRNEIAVSMERRDSSVLSDTTQSEADEIDDADIESWL
jgi:hypothetical protein